MYHLLQIPEVDWSGEFQPSEIAFLRDPALNCRRVQGLTPPSSYSRLDWLHQKTTYDPAAGGSRQRISTNESSNLTRYSSWRTKMIIVKESVNHRIFSNVILLFACVFSPSAESVSRFCDQKVSLHLQGLCSVSDGSWRQPDRQRPQRRGRTRDPFHMQVSESDATVADAWLLDIHANFVASFSSEWPHKAACSNKKTNAFLNPVGKDNDYSGEMVYKKKKQSSTVEASSSWYSLCADPESVNKNCCRHFHTVWPKCGLLLSDGRNHQLNSSLFNPFMYLPMTRYESRNHEMMLSWAVKIL